MEASDPIAAGTSFPIDIRDLTRRFGDVVAVDRLTLAVEPATILGFIGPNGAGKSTLIKMLTTLLPPTSGSATVAGHDITQETAKVRGHIGYVPQLLSADRSLTGYQNMLLSARLYAIPRSERRSRIADALALMGLADAADSVAARYSGGMIRRLEIAQSLLHRPAVLFLDEPMVGLDPAARDAMASHLLELRKRFGTTMIMTSHQMEEIDKICDLVAIIDRGRIVATGTPAELKQRVGPDATLDDVFTHFVSTDTVTEIANGFGDVRRRHRAARDHG